MRRYHLEKLSDDVDVDNGSLTLDGPVSATNTDHVCQYHYYSNFGDENTYEVLIPYYNDYISMRFTHMAGLTTGIHNWTPWVVGAEILNFDITGGPGNFWDTVGSNTLAPASATINITNSTDSNIAGSFSFIGQDAGNYTGSFSIDIIP